MSENLQNLTAIKRTSTVGRIVDSLVNHIKLSGLRGGDRLPPERELCEILGVSRPVLREALKALQVMNIIDIRQGAGAYLKNLVPEDVVEHLDIVFHLDASLYHDLYEARRILEGSIARMAAVNITSAQLAEIEENIKLAGANIDDTERFYQLDLDLHNLILAASGNRVIPVFMQSIHKLALVIRKKTNARPEIRKNTIHDHLEILKALRSRDPDLAEQAMENHLTNVEKTFFSKDNATEA